MTPVEKIEEACDKLPRQRDWMRLARGHVKVTLVSPLIAATTFTLAGPDSSSLLTIGGLAAFAVMVLCTYLFFGIFAALAVCGVSPVALALSRIPSGLAGRMAAFCVGGALGWVVCGMLVRDVFAFQLAAALTAAIGVAALESSWRRSAPTLRAR